LDDMKKAVMPGAERFELSGTNGACVLLVHGYTGTPGEMRMLGEHLNGLGFGAVGILLPGHGTTAEDLARTKFSDWCDAVEDEAKRARKKYAKVFAAASSMGGAVALWTAADGVFDRLALLSTPVKVYGERHVPRTKTFQKDAAGFEYAVKKRRIYDLPEKYWLSYDRYPLSPLQDAFAKIDLLEKERLARVRCPLLIMQSKVEKHVRPESAEIIFDKAGSADKKIVWYEHSGHELLLGDEREDVMRRIGEFMQRGLGN